MKKQWVFILMGVLIAGYAYAATYNFSGSLAYQELNLTETLDNVTIDNGTSDGFITTLKIKQCQSYTPCDIESWPANVGFAGTYQVSREYGAFDLLQFAYDNSTATWRQVGKTARAKGNTIKVCTGTCAATAYEWGDDYIWTNDNTTQVSATITLPECVRGRTFLYQHAASRRNSTILPSGTDTINGKTTARTVKNYGDLLRCMCSKGDKWICTVK
jgi:hypothetical protein